MNGRILRDGRAARADRDAVELEFIVARNIETGLETPVEPVSFGVAQLR